MIQVDHLSHSQVTTFSHCPHKWHYSHVEKVPKERTPGALAFGIALHDALAVRNESMLSGEMVDGANLFHQRWYQFVDDVETPIDFAGANPDDLYEGIALVNAYVPPKGIIGVEQEVIMTLADDIPPVHGRIDVIRQRNDGTLGYLLREFF